jgi:DNA-binding transcriptional ArsR family regulator
MESYNPQANLLRAISHPTRLAVLEILRDGEHCVCHMEATLGIRQSSISQQLMILREAGLVEVRRDGLNIFYHVVRPGIFDLWMLSMRQPESPGRACRMCTGKGRLAVLAPSATWKRHRN